MSDRVREEEDCETTELFPALRPVVGILNNNNNNNNNSSIDSNGGSTASSSPSSGAVPPKALPPQPLSVKIPPPPSLSVSMSTVLGNAANNNNNNNNSNKKKMAANDEDKTNGNNNNNSNENNNNNNNNNNNVDNNGSAADRDAEAATETEGDFAHSASTDCSALTLPTISTLTAATPLSAIGTPPYRQHYRHQLQIQQLQQQMQQMQMQAMHTQAHTQAQAHTQTQQWQPSAAVQALRADTLSPCPPAATTATHTATHTAANTQPQIANTQQHAHTHTATQPSLATSCSNAHEIFAGDLSFFCKEYDLYDLFSRFGYVLKVRIKRSEKDGRTLMYGFVVMQQLAEAQAAVDALHGFRFMGRDMRVELSKTKNALPVNMQSNKKKAPDYQVHVTFASYFPHDDVVLPREVLLRSIFELFAHVKDVAIKEYIIHPNINKQEGFCFVTFFSPDDARCVVDCINRRVFHGFIFSCSLSYHNPAELRPEYANHNSNQNYKNTMPAANDSSSHFDSANTITYPHTHLHGRYADSSLSHTLPPTMSFSPSLPHTHTHNPSLPVPVSLPYPSPYAPLSLPVPHALPLSAHSQSLVFPSVHSPPLPMHAAYPYMNTNADMNMNREATHAGMLPSSPLLNNANSMHTPISMPVQMHMPQNMAMSSSSSVSSSSSFTPFIYGMPSAPLPPQQHMHHNGSHPHMYARPQVMYSVDGSPNFSPPPVPHNSMFSPMM